MTRADVNYNGFRYKKIEHRLNKLVETISIHDYDNDNPGDGRRI
jgi:hypothetical protein